MTLIVTFQHIREYVERLFYSDFMHTFLLNHRFNDKLSRLGHPYWQLFILCCLIVTLIDLFLRITDMQGTNVLHKAVKPL